jgi:hypothetical protein
LGGARTGASAPPPRRIAVAALPAISLATVAITVAAADTIAALSGGDRTCGSAPPPRRWFATSSLRLGR